MTVTKTLDKWIREYLAELGFKGLSVFGATPTYSTVEWIDVKVGVLAERKEAWALVAKLAEKEINATVAVCNGEGGRDVLMVPGCRSYLYPDAYLHEISFYKRLKIEVKGWQ
jgi:hypothetical protein